MKLASFSSEFAHLLKRVLPSPFGIAIFLTIFVFLVAFMFLKPPEISFLEHSKGLALQWLSGLFNSGLLTFAFQMAFMLVLGHTLALTKPFSKVIDFLTSIFCRNTASAAFGVTLLTLLMAFFNWGLGLIFGAIFARKVGEYAVQYQIPINYPLIGAAGYSGLMVWHGGFSGSSLAKVAEPGELERLSAGLEISNLPEAIYFGETVFCPMNLAISAALLIILPLVMYALGKSKSTDLVTRDLTPKPESIINEKLIGAEKLDHIKWLGLVFGGLVLIVAFIIAVDGFSGVKFLNTNWINLVLLGFALVFHGSFKSFLNGLDQGIKGAAGILVQFPLYFGILGIMKDSGLAASLSQFFVEISTQTTYPIFTFISAGILNVFVPSGGGQWAIQGPIILQSATELSVPLNKSILAMAYGDQLTNMLQPFWALPLLGITGLKAKEILPYTLILMLVGSIIFLTGLLIF